MENLIALESQNIFFSLRRAYSYSLLVFQSTSERTNNVVGPVYSLLARCIINTEYSLQERESVKRCLQYRLIKPSKISFGQITAAVQYYCSRTGHHLVFYDS